MKVLQPDLSELNRLISTIRRSTTISDLLDNLLAGCTNFLRAEGGVVFLVDENRKVIAFANKGLQLRQNSQKYSSHPMEKLAELCDLIHGRDEYYLRNTLRGTKDETSFIYDLFFIPVPVSVVAVPVYSDEPNPIGVISVTSQSENAFSLVHKDLLTNVAQQTAATIEKVLKIDQYHKIASVSEILLEKFDYQHLVDKLTELYGANRCSLFVRTLREGKEVYSLKATTDETLDQEQISDIFYFKGEGLTGTLAERKTCLRVYDMTDSHELKDKLPGILRAGPKFSQGSGGAVGVRESFLGCSLNSLGEPIGVITMAKRAPGNYFSPHDEESLLILSRYISARMSLEEHIAQTEATRELGFLSQQVHFFTHDAKSAYSTLSGYLQRHYSIGSLDQRGKILQPMTSFLRS